MKTSASLYNFPPPCETNSKNRRALLTFGTYLLKSRGSSIHAVYPSYFTHTLNVPGFFFSKPKDPQPLTEEFHAYRICSGSCPVTINRQISRSFVFCLEETLTLVLEGIRQKQRKSKKVTGEIGQKVEKKNQLKGRKKEKEKELELGEYLESDFTLGLRQI